MAIDKLKVMLSFMREINDGNIPKSSDYGISNEELWDIVEACQDEGLIKGATHAGPILFLDSTKLTDCKRIGISSRKLSRNENV